MKIKESVNKVKGFVKENWKGILIGTAVTGLGIAGGCYIKAHWVTRNVKRLPIPENWDLGELTYFAKDPSGNVAAMINIPRGELARLGENLDKLNIDEKFDCVGALMTFVESTDVTKT